MLSIITITYNNFEELKKTVNSVPRFPFIEHVIINGGDDEDTKEYLIDFHGKVINEKDNGIADAFNKGINNSSGEAIMFLNSGDILLDKEYLADTLGLLEQNQRIDFIHSNLVITNGAGLSLFMKPLMKNPGRGMPYLHPTMVVRRSVFEKIGLFNTEYKIAMDFDLVVRMIGHQMKGYYLNQPNPVIEMDGMGVSIADENKAIKECYDSLKRNKALTPGNKWGYRIRVILFTLRQLMVKTGAGKLLNLMKTAKYS